MFGWKTETYQEIIPAENRRFEMDVTHPPELIISAVLKTTVPKTVYTLKQKGRRYKITFYDFSEMTTLGRAGNLKGQFPTTQ